MRYTLKLLLTTLLLIGGTFSLFSKGPLFYAEVKQTAQRAVTPEELKASRLGMEEFDRRVPRNEEENQQTFICLYKHILQLDSSSLDKLAAHFEAEADKKGWSSVQLAAEAVAFIQSFRYRRPSKIIKNPGRPEHYYDLFTPGQFLYFQEGDSDTKTLVMVLFLKKLGFDAVLLVSNSYSHTMVGLDIPGKGAGLVHNGRKYLIVESAMSIRSGAFGYGKLPRQGWEVVVPD